MMGPALSYLNAVLSILVDTFFFKSKFIYFVISPSGIKFIGLLTLNSYLHFQILNLLIFIALKKLYLLMIKPLVFFSCLINVYKIIKSKLHAFCRQWSDNDFVSKIRRFIFIKYVQRHLHLQQNVLDPIYG